MLAALEVFQSITLPCYGLSFFVNDGGDLESHDFTDMIYDKDQCIGILFGLFNQLVLCPKAQIEEEVSPRYILVLDSEPDHRWHDHKPCIIIRPHSPHRSNFLNPYFQDIKDSSQLKPDTMLYHIYKVDGTLGYLTGISSLNSRQYLAKLHALTVNACPSDLLTGRTGVEEAISLAWLVETWSILTWTTWRPSDLETFLLSHKSKRGIDIEIYSESGAEFKQHQNNLLHKAYYLYPSKIVAQFPKHSPVNVPHRTSLVDDLIYLSASIADKWSLNAPIMDDLSSWAEAWGNTTVEDYPSELLSFTALFLTSLATEISLHMHTYKQFLGQVHRGSVAVAGSILSFPNGVLVK